jgi:hypothetical protein
VEKYNSYQNQLLITIPNAGVQDLYRFRKSLLSILAKVNIENCDTEFKESLKTVYELLSHLKIDDCSKAASVNHAQKNLVA